ncbi:MAG: nucleotide sugar dehydrogenase, partial [Bacteroidota bacterium]|nr:nucleotide sugar dehydrogenase [Bacteroidota bacterium]
LAGREINDGMAGHIAKKVLQHIIQSNGILKEAKVLVMGATFKENVSDIRNSKVADVVKELKSYFLQVHVTDPHASSDELNHEYGFELTKELASDYEVVIVTVPHKAYLNMDDEAFAGITKSNGLVADIKGVFRGKISSRKYWSL